MSVISLVKKNIILKRRRGFSSLCELLCPLLLAAICIPLKTTLDTPRYLLPPIESHLPERLVVAPFETCLAMNASHPKSLSLTCAASDQDVLSRLNGSTSGLVLSDSHYSLRYIQADGVWMLQDMATRYLHGDSGAIPDISFNSLRSISFINFVSTCVTGLLTASVLISVSNTVGSVSTEREGKLRELLKINGLQANALYLSWMLTQAGVVFTISVLISAVLTFSSLLPLTSFPIVCLLVWSFGFSISGFALLHACPFHSVRVASFCSSICVMAGFAVNNALDSSTAICMRIFAMLFPQVAFSRGVLRLFEIRSIDGSHWRFFFHPHYIDNMSIGICLGMLIIDCLLWWALYTWLDQVLPQKTGKRKSFLFCLKRAGPKVVRASDPYPKISAETCQSLTPQEAKFLVSGDCVMTERLTKTYNETVAVDNLSVAFFRSQITCLLGHNGAGKSTLISILTGALTPTEGNALVYNQSVVEGDIDKVRKRIGFCPQEDIFWNELTVDEHLCLIADVKQVGNSERVQMIKSLLYSTGLLSKRSSRADTLSGGMKRKLQLCMSLIGSPDFVLLDEPTTGCDPHSRRMIWELLKQVKETSAMVISTHYMDEAEFIGDKIAIMNAGQLKAYGSVMFLKKAFDCGYTLTFKVNNTFNRSALLSKISKFVNERPRILPCTNDTEFAVRLPFKASNVFHQLFTSLDAQKTDLSIESFGLTCTRLDEVFIAVTQSKKMTLLNLQDDPIKQTQQVATLRGVSLWKSQLLAQILKQVNCSRRQIRSLLFMLLVPALLVSLGIFTSEWSDRGMKARVLDTTSIKVIYLSSESLRGASERLVDSMLIKEHHWRDIDSLPEGDVAQLPECGRDCQVGASIVKALNTHTLTSELDAVLYLEGNQHVLRIVTWMNSRSFDAAQAVINGAIRSSEGGERFRMKAPLLIKSSSERANMNQSENVLVSSMLVVALGFFAGSIAASLARERSNGVKHHMEISGMTASAHWFGYFIVDSVLYGFVAGLIVLLIGYVSNCSLGSAHVFGTFCLVILNFGPSLISSVYLFSLPFNNPTAAMNVISLIHFVFGIVLPRVSVLANEMALTGNHSWGFVRDAIKLIGPFVPSYNFGNSIVELSSNRISSAPFHIIIMSSQWLVYLIVVIVFEKLKDCNIRANHATSEEKKEVVFTDEAVEQEAANVATLTPWSVPCLLRALKVQYDKTVAVRSMSLAFKTAEVFALLGVNSSG